MSPAALADWEIRFRAFLDAGDTAPDAAHDLGHLRRVLSAARALGAAEGGDLSVIVPAAWLHDCVHLPKDSPDAKSASTLAARRATEWLSAQGFPSDFIPCIGHAIEAHSFRARIEPQTIEACVVQDADRLDALGAIGIARCFTVGGALARTLYEATDPFCASRDADDGRYTLDHFYAKLLKLPSSFRTTAGRKEAERRVGFMRTYLTQLESEIVRSEGACGGARPGSLVAGNL